MPLSIAWFDAEGDSRVHRADMEPCERGRRLPDLRPPGRTGSLEVPQGDLPSVGVEEGSRWRSAAPAP